MSRSFYRTEQKIIDEDMKEWTGRKSREEGTLSLFFTDTYLTCTNQMTTFLIFLTKSSYFGNLENTNAHLDKINSLI